MKVVIATGIFPPEIGGPATYAQKLIPLFEKAGWQIEVVTFGEPRPGVHAISRSRSFLIRFMQATRTIRALAKGADVIFALDNFSAGLPALIASKRTGVPLVSRIGGIFAYEEESKRSPRSMAEFLQGKKQGVIKFLYKTQGTILRNSKKVIATSGFLARVAESQGVAKERIEIIRTAPVISDLPSKGALRKYLHFDAKKTYLVSASRLIPHKDVRSIVRALALLPKQFNLIVVGEGDEEPAMRQLVTELKIDARVQFKGRIPQEDLQKLLKAADAYVLNSTYEGLSNTALEAMGLGTPVFLSKVEGNTDLVEDNKTGFLFAQGDPAAIAQSLTKMKNKKLMRLIATEAKRSVNTWEDVFERTKSVLESVQKFK